jgi:hypothetical protein
LYNIAACAAFSSIYCPQLLMQPPHAIPGVVTLFSYDYRLSLLKYTLKHCDPSPVCISIVLRANIQICQELHFAT